jgi:hypothetical protein
MGQPFTFFVDAGTGRGRLIYHRYDGHYGLITPPGERDRAVPGSTRTLSRPADRERSDESPG